MIQVGSILKIADKTGISLVQCIKVFGHHHKRIAFLGDVILVSVKWISKKRFVFLKARLKKRYALGTMHRVLIIRTRCYTLRANNINMRFDENAAIIVNKKTVPMSNRVYGPIFKDLCSKWPSLGCVSRTYI